MIECENLDCETNARSWSSPSQTQISGLPKRNPFIKRNRRGSGAHYDDVRLLIEMRGRERLMTTPGSGGNAHTNHEPPAPPWSLRPIAKRGERQTPAPC